MSATAVDTAPKPPRPLWRRIVGWALIVVVIGAAANLVGWDLRGWFSDLWDALTGIGVGYLVVGWSLQTVQTTMTALGTPAATGPANDYANMALSIAHRAYVLQTGQVVLSGTASELRQNPLIREAYLGEMQVTV